jgi:hypothetical protein
MRQSKIGTGEECIRLGILAAAILTGNASRKDGGTETGQMNVVVVPLQPLIRGMRSGCLAVNTGSESRRMKRGMMGRSLRLVVSFFRYMSLTTYETANSAYARFKHQKNYNHD